eukprot:8757057-Alexandrium_andersonii.AAC.1
MSASLVGSEMCIRDSSGRLLPSPIERKLRVCAACVLTRLLYSVGVAVLTSSQVRALEARHLSFLRHILKIPATWGAIVSGVDPVTNEQ